MPRARASADAYLLPRVPHNISDFKHTAVSLGLRVIQVGGYIVPGVRIYTCLGFLAHQQTSTVEA